MIRPPLEVADIVRTYGTAFVKQHPRWLTALHLKVLRAIVACRTAALGGHVEQCDSCGQRAISYNSCLNRHCPKCQAAARQTWLAERSAELLPVPYYHVVFTLPHVLAPLALQNKALVYGLLFRAAAETLLEIAADPQHLGAKIGFLAVLHTWGQTLRHHPHLHCVVPGGGLSPDHRRWIPCGHKFFLPVKVLAVVFRGKFLDALEQASHKHKLTLAGQLTPLQSPPVFAALLRTAAQRKWVVYAKRPFAGPAQVLAYLSRYTHRIAIANSRLLSMANGKITFRWRDYAHGYQSRTMTLDADEFLRRFLLHVLPPGFVRIRYFGMLANRQRKIFLNLSREYLQVSLPRQVTTAVVNLCQHCHRGIMRVIEVLSPTRLSIWLANAAQPENSS
ncbi:MAG TPA: IS91 family transposase [Candidatus Sulfotelmatobacter sp.]|nr:IS91 family transposase [Candidatus Sulfotelmatobacter sp.]